MNYKISNNVIKRLPRYIRYLDLLASEGVQKVSSGELGSIMGITASQIRQDLNCFGGFGQQGYGYNVAQLRDGIAAALGMGDRLRAVIIGLGNLGKALALNFRFEECGAELVAAFDVDPDKVGKSIGAVPVLHVSELESFIRDNAVDVAVLTLPQSMADGAA
ncbi:MAG: redox-sensing transcriptional repressor Rex, partial [Oscillospiraceae bacterium]|nr:redox-sensing transcriptional repressor Rex [Oscillospiraceae bacterium]